MTILKLRFFSGKKLWAESTAKTNDRGLTLISEDFNYAMYAKRGFEIDRRVPIDRLRGPKLIRGVADPNIVISAATADNIDSVVEYDGKVTSLQRSDYVTKWLLSDVTTSLVATRNGVVVGYGVVCLNKDNLYRLGPLFADSVAIAQTLTLNMLETLPGNPSFTMDADPNDPKIDYLIANRAEITQALKTSFIFTNSDIAFDKQKIFCYS